MSNTNRKVVRKKKRKTRPIVSLIFLMIFAVGCYLFFISFSEIIEIFQLKSAISSSQKQLDEVQSENDYLNAQKEKLSDPDYVISYARGNYMLSKDGDTIFYLPSNENKEE